MAISVVITGGAVSSPSAEQTVPYTVTVTNTGADVTLVGLSVSASPAGVRLAQPQFLVPNVAPGVVPTITSSAAGQYSFQAVFHSPSQAGSGPQDPGSPGPNNAAMAPSPFAVLTATAITSDGSSLTATSGSFFQPVLSAIRPFPIPLGGALQLVNGRNLASLMFLGAL